MPGADLMYPGYTGEDPVITDNESMGQATKGLCDPGTWGEPNTILSREFETRDGDLSWATVFGYDSPEAAAAGYKEIQDAARNCANTSDASIDEDDTSFFVSYQEIEGSSEPMINVTHLILSGDRVLWRVSLLSGTEYHCAVTPDDTGLELCDFIMTAPDAKRLLSAGS